MSAMAVADVEALKHEIVRRIDTESWRPTDVLKALQESYPDSEVKEAILQLLQEGKIELSSDRRLHVVKAA